MPGDTNLTFASQIYNLDVSFFVELRRRILGNYCQLRSELRIHAFAAVDGALWLDVNSFDNECCRFEDCVRSMSSTAARHAAEQALLLSRRTAGAHDSPNCKCALVPGTLVVLPSLSDFRSTDIQLEAERTCGTVTISRDGLSILGMPVGYTLWNNSGRLSGIGSLRRFLVIIYMDVKTCVGHYALASPAAKPALPWPLLSHAVLYASGELRILKGKNPAPLNIEVSDIAALRTTFCASPVPYGFFALCCCGGKATVSNICDVQIIDDNTISLKDIKCRSEDVLFVGFGRISPTYAPPRHWRNAMLALRQVFKFEGKSIRFMLVHTSVSNAAGSRMSEVIAVVYDVLLGKPAEPGSPITLSHGYHVNPEQMYIGGKRYENIYSFMDALDFKAKHRIDAELHLHMMKWRIMPQLKPENITGTRVCVIGAGALGCHIIRQLLAWGISDFVVVDHAKVANSTRQCLYDSQDIANQEYKAVAACAKIKRIRPDAQVLSMNLQVPMPGMCIIISRDLKLVGHFITEEQLKHSYSELENAMLTCDAVFLATDSKESRWLPSLIGAAHRAGVCKEHETPSGECTLDVDNTIQAGPLVISAGLAFDSFMVVRHGYGTFRGGCYFCTDVQPPHDTVSGRPMDETCTLVKPGAAAMCAAAAAELFISLTQHPKRFEAPYTECRSLGGLTHTIHMSISDLSAKQFYVESSNECVCCSFRVVEMLKPNPIPFLLRAMRNPETIGEISGLHRTLNTVSNYEVSSAKVESNFVVL